MTKCVLHHYHTICTSLSYKRCFVYVICIIINDVLDVRCKEKTFLLCRAFLGMYSQIRYQYIDSNIIFVPCIPQYFIQMSGSSGLDDGSARGRGSRWNEPD